MISLDDACNRIRRHVSVGRVTETCSLEMALGRVLAEPVVAPDDSPPYDKAMVDGYAVITADLDRSQVRLRVVEEIHAGHVPQRALERGQAARIMTGAPLPLNADAVVMVEQTCRGDDPLSWVEFPLGEVRTGQNILRQGEILGVGAEILPSQQCLRPIELGLLAEAGRTDVVVRPRPRVALIQTGDELVSAEQPLGPGQIRNSNGPMLRAMIRYAGGIPEDLGIVKDELDSLATAIRRGLAADILVLSGGVSAGNRDLVPHALAAAGVECVFHQVNLRPGKPLWFGVRPGPQRSTLVFGLPGNPVSSFVCCRLFVTPTIRTLAGYDQEWHWGRHQARLADSLSVKGSRATLWPASWDRSAARVRPIQWLGSADPFSLARCNGLIYFPQAGGEYAQDQLVSVIALHGEHAD